MKNNKSPILKISNIKWDQEIKDTRKLPVEIEVEWGGKEWDYNQVSNWLSSYYKAILKSLSIEELENKASGGG
tara:strand:+ start:276 stop:494 length:219 start_codon:yes stop_codon:yes gene_type:complete